jgi:ADP-ribose pyrophosphatase YjhB (NUDIX family)
MSECVPKPIAAVIGVVVQGSKVLLVRRINPPDAGKWGFPGGKIQAGEPMPFAAEREVREETSMVVRATQVLTAIDAFDRDEKDALRTHYVLIAVLCDWLSGVPQAADDVSEAAWFEIADVNASTLAMSEHVAAVASLAAAASCSSESP